MAQNQQNDKPAFSEAKMLYQTVDEVAVGVTDSVCVCPMVHEHIVCYHNGPERKKKRKKKTKGETLNLTTTFCRIPMPEEMHRYTPTTRTRSPGFARATRSSNTYTSAEERKKKIYKRGRGAAEKILSMEPCKQKCRQ